MSTRITYWWCAVCERTGWVEMGEHVDASTGIQEVYRDHSKVNPNCEERYYIRVSLDRPVEENMNALGNGS